jgi:hypothetical protein
VLLPLNTQAINVFQPAGAVPTVPLSNPSVKNTPAPLETEELLADDGFELEVDATELATEERLELETTEEIGVLESTEERLELATTDERAELEATEATDEFATEDDAVASHPVPVTSGISGVPLLLP